MCRRGSSQVACFLGFWRYRSSSVLPYICLAKAKIDKVVGNLGTLIDEVDYNDFRASIGEPFSEKLIEHLKAFDDPHQAVRREVDMVRRKPFVPNDIVLHGLVYELETGRLEVVVDGYAPRSE